MVAVPLVEVGAAHVDDDRVECAADARLARHRDGRVFFDRRIRRAKHRRAIALQRVDDLPDASGVVIAM